MFTGTLKTFSLTSLIQVCHHDNSSGTIAFSKGKTVMGKIGFSKGSVVYADFAGTYGFDAVKQLALLEELDFKFDEKIILPATNINADINFILIDCAKTRDDALEYLDKIKNVFSSKYHVEHAFFYEYSHCFFSNPEIFDIKYFEIAENKKFIAVYFDKNINARIELSFKEKILTDDLLMFMEEKGVFL